MSKHYNLDRGQTFIEPVVDSVMEFLGSATPQIRLEVFNSTTVQVVAATDNDQAAVAVNGRWRYRTTTVQAAHPGGASGTYDVYVTGTDNVYTPGGSGSATIDGTDYAFGLQVRAVASPPATALYRKVGEVDWSGTAITAIRQIAGNRSDKAPLNPTAPIATMSAARVRAAAAQSAAILTIEDSTGAALASFSSTGTLALPNGGMTIGDAGTITRSSANNFLVTGQGLALDPGAGTVSATLTLTGRNAGVAASATLVANTIGTLTYNVPTGATHIFQINATTEATIDASGINLASGGTYRINGTDIASTFQQVDSDLTAIANNSTNGIYARTGTGTVAARTITGTAGEIDVANGDGVAGDPTLSLPAIITQATTLSSTSGLVIDTGSGTNTGLLTITGRNAGAAASATWTVSTGGSVTQNVPTAQSYVWQINSAQEATLTATGLSLSSGNTFQINGTDIFASTQTVSGAWTFSVEPTSNLGLTVRPSTAAHGYVRLVPGAAAQAGYIEFHKSGPTRYGYIGFDNADLTTVLENGASFTIQTASTGNGTLTTQTSALEVLNNNLTFNGNVTAQRASAFFAPTYVGTGGARTITTAATLAISGAPVAGASMTLTNTYALWVEGGKSRFEGAVDTATQFQVGGAQISSTNLSDGANIAHINATETVTQAWTFSSNVTVTGQTTFERTNDGDVGWRVKKASDSFNRTEARGDSSLRFGTGAADTDTYFQRVTGANGGLQLNFTGLSGLTNETHGLFILGGSVRTFSSISGFHRGHLRVGQPEYAGATAQTISETASVYIDGAPIAGTNMTLTVKHALWVGAGTAKFDGGLIHTAGGASTTVPRDVRGSVTSAGAVRSGTGFSVSKLGTGLYRITYSTAFSAEPVINANANGPYYVAATTPGTGSVDLEVRDAAGTLTDSVVWFSAESV